MYAIKNLEGRMKKSLYKPEGQKKSNPFKSVAPQNALCNLTVRYITVCFKTVTLVTFNKIWTWWDNWELT